MRRFVIVGQKVRASPDFLLADIPSTSGRMDVLARSVRAALLVSHAVRRDTFAYLVMLGLPERPRTVRIDGSASRYLRPDERSLATTLQKALALPVPPESAGFCDARRGVAVAEGGIDCVLPELAASALYLLEPSGTDIRSAKLQADEASFILGDHLGLPPGLRERLLGLGATPLSVGPRALHTEDAIALVHNELDRRDPTSCTPA
jgi:tRNA (pseudouridine54-N1)-methyltransferase